MADWYYHDPAQGRVGPYTAEQLRTRYRERRIQRDTLVWHAGLREWQPLDRCSEELDLDSVQPDASLPPPLPPQGSGVVSAVRTPAGAHARRTARDTAPKRGLSGCAIVAIVLAALAVPTIGILAAIAVPAYQDYSIRARNSAGLYGAASAIQRAVDDYAQRAGRCPGNGDMAPILQRFASVEPKTRLRFGSVDGGGCAFEFTLSGAKAIDGRTWVFVSAGDGDWDCSGGDLPARYRPALCRAE